MLFGFSFEYSIMWDWDARCWQDAPSESCGYAEGTDCLRRLDSTKTMADYDTSESSGVEHRNGSIWSSATSRASSAGRSAKASPA